MRGWWLVVLVGVAACTSSTKATGGGGGSCEALGYLAPSGGACPKGMCLASDSPEPCCGSVCATCEAKGLVSASEAGACPVGLCVSSDLTPDLHCCDVCAGGASDAGQAADAEADSGGGPGADAGTDAAPDAGDAAPE